MKGDGDDRAAGLRRRLVRGAIEAGAPFALWREPGDTTVCGLVAAPGETPVGPLDFAAVRPGLAVSRYDNFEGDACRFLAAELILSAGGLSFVTADGELSEAPCTDIQRALLAAVEAAPETGPAIPPDTALLRAASPPAVASEDHYRGLVASAVDKIKAGRFDKIVASRAMPRPLPEGFDPLAYFERLCARYPQAYVGLTGIPGVGLWVVATPETLMRVEPGRVSTMALAGTQPVAPDADLATVLWSGKFIEEQGLVAQYVRRAFAECEFADVAERGPRTVRAANLAHLCTYFDAAAGGDPAAFAAACSRFLRLMHPTSAVCGMPRQAAIDFLAAEEGYDRGHYCGFLGPVGIGGRSSLYVNLRSAQVIGGDLWLYVGAGVTGESDPQAEWQETIEKSKTLGALVEPG
ncbi:MAG: chorismate-binding protein [Bauldia litoralis]